MTQQEASKEKFLQNVDAKLVVTIPDANFMFFGPSLSDFSQMSCQRVTHSIWRSVPYPDRFLLKNILVRTISC